MNIFHEICRMHILINCLNCVSILRNNIIDGMLHVTACDLDQAQHGCRIDNGACSCAYGCKSEYRYANLRECTDALKVRFIILIDFN